MKIYIKILLLIITVGSINESAFTRYIRKRIFHVDKDGVEIFLKDSVSHFISLIEESKTDSSRNIAQIDLTNHPDIFSPEGGSDVDKYFFRHNRRVDITFYSFFNPGFTAA
jgi:hypothetical protein